MPSIKAELAARSAAKRMTRAKPPIAKRMRAKPTVAAAAER
jgi:hypothetical protein